MAAFAGAGADAASGVTVGSIIGIEMPEFEAPISRKMDGGNILISVLTADAIERRPAKAIFKNAGSRQPKPCEHAYNRPSEAAAVGVAMTPASQQLPKHTLPTMPGPLLDEPSRHPMLPILMFLDHDRPDKKALPDGESGEMETNGKRKTAGAALAEPDTLREK
jgi:hypothetical protein